MNVWLVQEWEAFTGLIVSDTKHEPGKDTPNWIEPDRIPAVLLLKVTKRITRALDVCLYISNSAVIERLSCANGLHFDWFTFYGLRSYASVSVHKAQVQTDITNV